MKALLALVALILAAALWLQWRHWPPGSGSVGANGLGPSPTQPMPPGAGDIDPMASLRPLDPAESYAAINDRTLFRPDRRPPEPESEVAAQPQPETDSSLDQVDLSAIAILPGLSLAWISDPSGGLRRLRLGDGYDGWTVKDITPDTLVLERQGTTSTLLLRDFSKTAPPPAQRPGQPPAPAAARPRHPPQSPAGNRGAGTGRRDPPKRQPGATPPSTP